MKLAVCTLARKEAPNLAEWLAFHHLLGFDACIVGDNLSSDGTASVARARGRWHQRVDLVPWNQTGPGTQLAFYSAVCGLYQWEFDWILFIDVDEFLSTPGLSLREYLGRYGGDSSSLSLPWLMFYGMGYLTRPPGLTIGAYTQCTPWESHHHTKMFLRPGQFVAWINPHFAATKGEARGSRGEHVRFAGPGVFWHGYRDQPWAFIHHYYYRSKAEWGAKLARGRPDSSSDTKRPEHWDLAQRVPTRENLALAKWVGRVEAELRRIPTLGGA